MGRLWVTVTEWNREKFEGHKEREYYPGRASVGRLNKFMINHPCSMVFIGDNHLAANWDFIGQVEPYKLPFMDEPERCYACGSVPEYLYEGKCSTCHNMDMAVEEQEQIHHERWLYGEQ
jgi:hypothetical protein